jgi:Rrf2 family protein
MIVTTKGKNALKFMVDLSMYQGDKYVRLKDVARREDISEKYLEHIVSNLQRNKKVISARGANGGYRLAKDPKEYTVGEILKCIENDLSSSNCISEAGSDCGRREQCICYPLWVKLDKAINGVLDYTTLQDLIDWDGNISI